jgi:hypothetical protein
MLLVVLSGGYMKNKLMLIMLTTAIALLVLTNRVSGSSLEQINIMLIVDASSYSAEEWHTQTKFYHIRTGVLSGLQELSGSPSWGLNMGLRLFGDTSQRERQNCTDFRLAAKLDWFEPVLISQLLENTRPKGKNCLATVIASSVNDFPRAGSKSRNFLVCITSSRDECTKDELETVQYLLTRIDLDAIHVIGVDLPEDDRSYLHSVFQMIPGEFINVSSPAALTRTISDVLNKKTHSSATIAEPEAQTKENN